MQDIKGDCKVARSLTPYVYLYYNYTARYFAIHFYVLHVNFNLLLHNK